MFELDGSILASEAQDPPLVTAVETVILCDADYLEFLGELLKLEFSAFDQLFCLGQSGRPIRGGDECEEGLRLQGLDY